MVASPTVAALLERVSPVREALSGRSGSGERTPTGHVTASSDHSSDEPPGNEARTVRSTASKRKRSGDIRETKRTHTYCLRKDEMARLRDEIARLQTQLQKVERQPHIVSESLDEAMRRHTGLEERARRGSLAIASIQSLMASNGRHSRNPPIGGFIHLPRDPSERQRTLTQLKFPRIYEGIRYVLTRSQFLDLTTVTRQIDTYETESGDFVATHWEISPLPEARSVLDAYRELQYFTDTQEISMSEKLGMTSIRESESDPVDGTQAMRLSIKHETGIESAMNLAIFSHYFEESKALSQPHAVSLIDFIDQDDLYPRELQNRLHNDAASMTLIVEVPPSSPEGRPVVTMVRWAFLRVNNNPYRDRSELELIGCEGVSKWCDVMLKCVRERLAWHRP